MEEDGPISLVAMQGLVNVGDADAATGLAKLVSDTTKKVSVRSEAALALPRMPSQSAIAIPALIGACQDPDAELRETVADSLESMGTDAREAAPTLKAMLADSSPKVRIKAANALYTVRGSDDLAVKTVVNESHNPDYLIRAFAVASLDEMGKKEPGAVAVLIASLGDDYPNVRSAAARALRRVGRPAADKAISAVEKLLDDPDPDVRKSAKWALDGLKGK